jgi:hypothetical protein
MPAVLFFGISFSMSRQVPHANRQDLSGAESKVTGQKCALVPIIEQYCIK